MTINLKRNERVCVNGHPMVVVEQDVDTVEVADPGWDGESSGVRVPVTEVEPLEQMSDREASAFLDALDPEDRASALAYLSVVVPWALLEFGRENAPELLPQRLRGENTLIYPAVGSDIPGQPGYVVGECGHRVAASEWRSGFRTCERCGSDWEDPGTGASFFACEHKTTDEPGHDPDVCRRLTDVEMDALMRGSTVQDGGAR
ncbi:hypothetical protein [Actinomadura litoris]|uniref:hypothetical protein n=1 Tax=Actinomadura litoris TaxID=2678616 RepID=UPI001FA75610|nr:hypothetical protein [Actinomadura litoris]